MLACGGNDPNRSIGDARRAPADACAADVIVLADRSSRDGNPAHREVTPEPATTAQPGCRGPPAGASQRQVRPGQAPIGKSFREKDQSRANAPADPAVVDNLGDSVPVGAAELEVVETYLDDVLGELLATVAVRSGPPRILKAGGANLCALVLPAVARKVWR